ncbi:hypothetical protein MJM28_29565, partial [Salmonella enterica subsp. enterica serovar Montevideo]|nr:hypothetical protein [Salmonella enterica subsp. enterica serovar Montevideo]
PGNLTAKKDADFQRCARKAVQPRRSDGADDATVVGRPRAAGLPNLRDCEFPSKSLAGVGVAFYLMLALRTFLRDKGWFDERNIA